MLVQDIILDFPKSPLQTDHKYPRVFCEDKWGIVINSRKAKRVRDERKKVIYVTCCM